MPAQNRLGSNNLDRAEKAWPEPSKPDQQRPVTAVEPDTRRPPPQRHIKLMAKDEVLGFKARARLEAIDDDDRQQPQDPKHRIRSCADSPRLRESQRMRFSEGTVPVTRELDDISYVCPKCGTETKRMMKRA